MRRCASSATWHRARSPPTFTAACIRSRRRLPRRPPNGSPTIGNWPDFLDVVWARIGPYVGSAEYETRKGALIDETETYVRRWPPVSVEIAEGQQADIGAIISAAPDWWHVLRQRAHAESCRLSADAAAAGNTGSLNSTCRGARYAEKEQQMAAAAQPRLAGQRPRASRILRAGPSDGAG
jgi:hypothetical protein